MKIIDIFAQICYTEFMNCIFDKEKIERVLSDFYSSTGIAITLYDASETIIATSPIFAEFCSYIRSKRQCVKNCDTSNFVHMKEVSECRRITCYSCHAGLKEIILPIIYEDVLIAYLQIGQLRDEEEGDTSAEKLAAIARQYGLDTDKLISLYEKTTAISQEKLRSVCNILEILIKSFWMEGLISDSRSMLSVKIERYIEEHLSERIYIEDLCNKFFLSKNAIYELFRKEFNTTVNDFILQKRMRKAQKLLKSELNLNITQISLLCGFSDYNYFIRSFKKHIGITPLKFRKAIF